MYVLLVGIVLLTQSSCTLLYAWRLGEWYLTGRNFFFLLQITEENNFTCVIQGLRSCNFYEHLNIKNENVVYCRCLTWVTSVLLLNINAVFVGLYNPGIMIFRSFELAWIEMGKETEMLHKSLTITSLLNTLSFTTRFNESLFTKRFSAILNGVGRIFINLSQVSWKTNSFDNLLD